MCNTVLRLEISPLTVAHATLVLSAWQSVRAVYPEDEPPLAAPAMPTALPPFTAASALAVAVAMA